MTVFKRCCIVYFLLELCVWCIAKLQCMIALVAFEAFIIIGIPFSIETHKRLNGVKWQFMRKHFYFNSMSISDQSFTSGAISSMHLCSINFIGVDPHSTTASGKILPLFTEPVWMYLTIILTRGSYSGTYCDSSSKCNALLTGMASNSLGRHADEPHVMCLKRRSLHVLLNGKSLVLSADTDRFTSVVSFVCRVSCR